MLKFLEEKLAFEDDSPLDNTRNKVRRMFRNHSRISSGWFTDAGHYTYVLQNFLIRAG